MMFDSPQYPRSAYYEVRTPPQYSSPAYDPSKFAPAYTPYYPTHARHASYEPNVTYSTTPLPSYMSYQDPYLPPVKVEYRYASQTDRMRAKASAKTSSSKKKHSSSTHHKDRVYVEVVDEPSADYYDYRSPKGSPPPPYDTRYIYPEPRVERHADPPSHKTRPRATSTPQKPTRQPSTKPRKPGPAAAHKPARKATAKDAARAGIPEGFSLKNWDPDEEPILLLGSVFDANTLGKWIYDWTVFHHGAGAPIADNAGDLWLSLIELASKMKRAEECLPRIRRRSKRETVDDFLEDGTDLLYRLDKILRNCEDYMWAAVRKENGGKKTTSLGPSSGCAFVDAIFGRDRELEATEKLMSDIRYWTHRFNHVCEPILRKPKE